VKIQKLRLANIHNTNYRLQYSSGVSRGLKAPLPLNICTNIKHIDGEIDVSSILHKQLCVQNLNILFCPQKPTANKIPAYADLYRHIPLQYGINS